MDNLAYSVRDDYKRMEMIGGKVYMMAGAATNHVNAAMNISFEFKKYLIGKPCKVYPDGMTVYFSDKDYVLPDLAVVCDRSKIKPDGIHGAPDLVVEILSPSTQKRDLGDKMRLYEKHGVREYWIVNANDKSVNVYLPVDGRFELADAFVVYPQHELDRMSDEERANVKTEFSPFLFPKMKLKLDDVFDDMLE